MEGAVKTKTYRKHHIFILFLIFIFVICLPVSALAVRPGYHHEDWSNQYCLQAYDITMTAKEVHKLREQGLLEQEVIRRSSAIAREWGTWVTVSGGFQSVGLGVLGNSQPAGTYPVTLYVHANDQSKDYIQIMVTVTETATEPTTEPTSTPQPTTTSEPTESQEPEPTKKDETPEGSTTMQGTATPGNAIAEQIPQGQAPTQQMQEPEEDENPEPAQTEVPANGTEEPHPQYSEEVLPKKAEEKPKESQWTPLATALFGGAGAAGILFGISIGKDVGTIRWYNGKKK